MSYRILLIFIIIMLASLLPSPLNAASLSSQTSLEISALLNDTSNNGNELRTLLPASDRSYLRPFYEKRQFLPYWIADHGMNSAGSQLLDTLRDASLEGLCTEDYLLSRIEALALLEADYRRDGILYDPQHIAMLDILMTQMFLEYATDLSGGRVDPLGTRLKWYANGRDIDPAYLLERVGAGTQLKDIVAGISPLEPAYLRLKETLALYRSIAIHGGWPTLKDGVALKEGDHDERIRILRQRLKITGDLSSKDEEGEEKGNRFDANLVEALKYFQMRHGLKQDGVLGTKTVEALNISVEKRIRQIELNMERWRWLPRSLGKRYLVVNIADFELSVIEYDKIILSMPVIVGKQYRKTPVFSSLMTYLEFAPYWTVPPTILREDKLPVIKKNPGWIEKNYFEILDGGGQAIDPLSIDWQRVRAETFPGVLRQKPGPTNALGGIKFMFPNPFSVYLHDTPERHLFQHDVRSFSSGCIRIERPLDLARYLLDDEPDWTYERIFEQYKQFTQQTVTLKNPLPVYILYWTAWVDGNGCLNFRNDHYLRDEDLDRALQKEGVKSEQILKPAEGNKGPET